MTEAFPSFRSPTLVEQLRSTLLELARQEDECAADEAAAQRYWEPCPASIPGHRAAAAALRERADQLLAILRPAALPRHGDLT
jgi:hypothetical protein